ncbi:MAG TPA: transposase [Ktedonobacterales bacterium]|nr:transposase [Ktedonobacterales bacterium]
MLPLGLPIQDTPYLLKELEGCSKSKPQLAVELIQELVAQGFHFSVVLADSRYGESSDFIAALHRRGLQYVVAIRSHHIVWTFPGARVRQTRWRPFDRVFTDGTTERRYRCEFVFGKRTPTRYCVVTTDPVHLPAETTWHLMTNLPGNIEQTVGATFGLRTQDPSMAANTRRMSSGGPTIASPTRRASSAGGNWSCALICSSACKHRRWPRLRLAARAS